jgi:outer membrane protein with beta-barrel domain
MRRLLVVLMVAWMVAVPARAQERHGFFMSAGLGWGSLGCDECTERTGGTSGNLLLGAAVSPHWVVGLGGTGWLKNLDASSGLGDGAQIWVGTLDLRARYYPSLTGGLFFTGGAGLGRNQVNAFGQHLHKTGTGALLGLGYDIPVAGSLDVSPYWNAFIIRADGSTNNAYQLGIGLTLHPSRATVETPPVRQATAPMQPTPAPSQPAYASPPAPPAPARVEQVPHAPPPAGAAYVGDARIGIYYPLGCGEYHGIPDAHRVYFPTVGAAEKDGFKRSGDC